MATGVFAAWRQVGVSWGALTTTPYGKLVLYKSGGLVVLVALASVSRTTVHGGLALPGTRSRQPESRPPSERRPSRAPRPVGADVAVTGRRRASGPGRLRTAVAAEIVVLLVVLALTAVLVNARPAKQAYAAPFSTEVKAGPTLVNLVVDPAKAGPLTVHLYILTSAGLIDNVPEVDATMSNAGAGICGPEGPAPDRRPRATTSPTASTSRSQARGPSTSPSAPTTSTSTSPIPSACTSAEQVALVPGTRSRPSVPSRPWLGTGPAEAPAAPNAAPP